MTSPLPAQIGAVSGQPATIRVGKVETVSPLTVSIQGTVLADVGIVGVPSLPAAGQPVLVVGQSAEPSSDAASWAVLGAVTPAAVASGVLGFEQPTGIGGFTNTVFQTGVPSCGVNFVAPPSGQVRVDWHARFQSNTVGTRALVSVQVTEPVSGTVVSPSADGSSLEGSNTVAAGADSRLEAAMFRLVRGLTPGVTYVAVTQHKMIAAGNGDVFTRSILVSPV